MRQILACLFAFLFLVPAAFAQGRLAGGPDGDRPEYRGGADAPGGTIEIWDGEQWRPFAYCQSNPCGAYNAATYRQDTAYRGQAGASTNIQTYAHLDDGRQYTYADCPEGTRPSTGEAGERICLRSSNRVTVRDDLPRHQTRDRYRRDAYQRDSYRDRRTVQTDQRYTSHVSDRPEYRGDYRRPASPCHARQTQRRTEYRQDWGGCYQSREWTDYRRTEYRGDIDMRVYPREWYGQDGRYWREVRGHGGTSSCACSGFSRDRHFSECGHYDHTTHYEGGGYYGDNLAWAYFGGRSGYYGGGGGGGNYNPGLVLPSAGARARSYAGAGANAGSGVNVNTSTRVNTNVGVSVRVGGGGRYGGRGGHGGGCRSGCGGGGGHGGGRY